LVVRIGCGVIEASPSSTVA